MKDVQWHKKKERREMIMMMTSWCNILIAFVANFCLDLEGGISPFYSLSHFLYNRRRKPKFWIHSQPNTVRQITIYTVNNRSNYLLCLIKHMSWNNLIWFQFLNSLQFIFPRLFLWSDLLLLSRNSNRSDNFNVFEIVSNNWSNKWHFLQQWNYVYKGRCDMHANDYPVIYKLRLVNNSSGISTYSVG